jgi:hypothetical protein
MPRSNNCRFRAIAVQTAVQKGQHPVIGAHKPLIPKGGNPGEVVGARGFEPPARSFIQYHRRSPVPRKQRLPRHFTCFPNLSEHQQTAPDFEQLLHTHYTRKAFFRHKPGG